MFVFCSTFKLLGSYDPPTYADTNIAQMTAAALIVSLEIG